MSRRLLRAGSCVGCLLVVAAGLMGCGGHSETDAGCPGDPVAARPDWALTSSAVDAGYDGHAFVGNGYLGLRVPPRGMGYDTTGEPTAFPLFTPRFDGAFVAGLFGRTPGVADGREVAAAIPNWSDLTLSVDGQEYSPTTPSDRLGKYRQTLFMRCGLLKTSVQWTTTTGKVTDIEYDVLTDRREQHVGAVRVRVVPHWTGELTVTDRLDAAGARRLGAVTGGRSGNDGIRAGFRTDGTDVAGSLVTVLTAPKSASRQVIVAADHGVSQRAAFGVQADEDYALTKFVGVDTSLTSRDPQLAASAAVRRAADSGWGHLLADTAAAWRKLWAGDIELPGRPDLQIAARGALYGLYSNTNARQDNSISPVGLTSDNYGGEVYWDADTWMLPSLLSFSPELAKSLVDYRYKTLPAAQENARRLGFQGAFYPWNSGSRGELDECHSWGAQPHCVTQIHLQGDISLAAWQYYLATHDTGYLRERSWPIMRNIAEFWVSRVRPNPDGSSSIVDVAGPDEFSNGVDDAVYTNAVAALALRNATRAAEILGQEPPAEWTRIADNLRMPRDPVTHIFEQYQGYSGSPIKQADAVLLTYPLEWPMSPEVAAAMLGYYSERTVPDGPAMTDAVHAIDSAATALSGCATGTFLEKSVLPFLRGPYQQFVEANAARTDPAHSWARGPAFTFLTAAGGYLQTFTNGLLGMRQREDRLVVNPTLPPNLNTQVILRAVHWQGRTFDAEIHSDTTTLTQTVGAPLTLETPTGPHRLTTDHPVTLPTRRPDQAPTPNLARCHPVTSDSARPGSYAEAAVDGSDATVWAPQTNHGSLTVDLGRQTLLHRIVTRYDQPPPVATLAVSPDRQTWTPAPVDPQTGTLLTDISARYLRVTLSTPGGPVGLRELEAFPPGR